MKKLTAEKCRSVIDGFKWMASEGPGMSIRDEYDIQAYEIALPILEQQGRGEVKCEWIEWRGHKPPVSDGQIVDIKFRDGSTLKRSGNSHVLSWADRGFHSDIIAYRIIPERDTNQTAQQSGTPIIEGTMPANQNGEQ